jgi:CRP/FNR family nitrogen fixation transcriptional regulator
VIELAMTRQDIGDYLGLTIETVSRTMSQFERDGLISLPTARRVSLTDLRGLRELNS